MPITKPKGTYDVLPNEAIKWQYLEEKIKEVCKKYNFKEIRTPIFEESNLFHRGIGDESDIVTKETYDFMDRGNRNITLRPEGTAGVIRSYVENKLYINQNVTKLYYMGPIFRYERPQKGRYRQFNQFGVEAIGSNSPNLDVEVISFACDVLKAIGLKGVKVKINSIGDKESRNIYRKELVKHFSKYKDCLCGDCLNRLEKNPLRILDCKIDSDKDFFKEAPKINDYLNSQSKGHFEEVLKGLENLGISYEISPNLVRGLDYYSHTVFEIEAEVEGFGSQNVIGGGGRYDDLVSDLEGPSTPAIGMAFGVDRLLIAMEYEGLFNNLSDDLDCYLITLGDNAKLKGMQVIANLRNNGLSCETDFMNKGIKAQFKQADLNKAKFTLILGDDEINNGLINVKNNANDLQEAVKLNELVKYLLEVK